MSNKIRAPRKIPVAIHIYDEYKRLHQICSGEQNQLSEYEREQNKLEMLKLHYMIFYSGYKPDKNDHVVFVRHPILDKINEIKTDEDLKKAIARFDEIWSARPGDPDWEERETLVELISAYEDEHVHIPTIDKIMES